MDSYVIGVDIGGTGTKYGIVDKDGNVLHSSSMATNTHEQVHTYIDELYEKVSELIEKVGGVGRIKGIGVGAPNGNIYTGTIEYAPNLPWKGIIPFAKMLQDKFKLPVKLTNDANAAAVGEMMYGAAKGMKDFIMITLGTGVGGAAVIDRKIFLGGDGNAMEPGHVPSKNGKVLERNVGKKELLQMANRMRAEYTGETSLPSDGTISTTALVVAAEEGDALAQAIWDEVGTLLGDMLVSLIRILDIKNIFIGGGLSASFDFIVPSMEKQLNYWLTPAYLEKLTIKKALLGNDAGLLGAASLCF